MKPRYRPERTGTHDANICPERSRVGRKNGRSKTNLRVGRAFQRPRVGSLKAHDLHQPHRFLPLASGGQSSLSTICFHLYVSEPSINICRHAICRQNCRARPGLNRTVATGQAARRKSRARYPAASAEWVKSEGHRWQGFARQGAAGRAMPS